MQLAATYEDTTEIQKQFKYLKHDKLKYSMMDALPSEITKLKKCECLKITKIELAEIMLSILKYLKFSPR